MAYKVPMGNGIDVTNCVSKKVNEKEEMAVI